MASSALSSTFCLIPSQVEKFKKSLRDGEVDPFKLAAMTSEERHSTLAKIVGEDNARQVNALYESKLLLKNQQQGYIAWAKKVSGMTTPVRRNLIDRISKMDDRVLNPTDEKAFLQDLASTKLGIGVTREEAVKLTDLSRKIQDAKAALQEDVTNSAKQVEFGTRIFDMQQYLDELNPTKPHIVANILGTPRSLVASLDFVSAPFRHGFFSISDPAWIKNYVQIPRLLMSESAFRTRMGSIYGHPYYESLVKGGLRIFKTGGDLSKQEEQFASNILNKFGPTRGSKRAYTGFLNGLRMDMGVALLKAAELRGDDIRPGSKIVKDFSTMINNMTGAGSLGRFESAAPEINLGIFSARMQVARFNMMNPVTYLNPKVSSQARVFALKNLVGSFAISAILLGLASLAGLKVNMTDPNKTDFGEITIGNLHIDVTGGNRTYITLLSRLMSGQYVNSAGKVTQLGIGAFKPLTRMDLVQSFLLGKLAPGLASTMADFLTQSNGKDPYGNPVDVPHELMKQFIPLNITNGMDAFNNDPGHTFASIVLGLFGVPVSTTPAATTSWDNNTSKSIQEFHQKVGDARFKEAAAKFDNTYTQWETTTLNSKSYQDLSPSGQQTVLTDGRAKIEKEILKSYGFVYKTTPTPPQQKSILKGLSPR